MARSIHSCSRKYMFTTITTLALVIVLIQYTAVVASSECTREPDELTDDDDEKREALKYKAGSIASILIAGAVGVSLPLLGNKVPALSPEKDMFFMIKAFAAGVILSTAFVHILPDAFDKLSSPCLSANPWGDFPFAGFVAMLSSIVTLMMDTIATGFYKKKHYATSSSASTATDHRHNNMSKTRQQVIRVDIEELGGADQDDKHAGHVHVHTHATHGHAHGSAADLTLPELIRHRIISQVLELGIVVHSVIIGISLGASESLGTIKPLMVALSFHQFFEGMGLGGCISQAQFKSRSAAMMATFFSLTTPLGIAVGIGICSIYKASSPTAIVVEGILNSASAGILIYMALVDLLAADFMNPRMQTNLRLQIGSNVSLLLGAACMSLLAIWA